MKKVLILILCISMIVGLTACNNSNGEKNNEDISKETKVSQETEETEETKEVEETEEETEESEETIEESTTETEAEKETKETEETEKATEKETEKSKDHQSKPAPKETEAAKPTYKKVNDVKYAKSNVNVRSGPGTSHKKIGSLKAGQKVTRIGVADNGWGVIEYKGKEGYVSGNYLVDSKPEPKPEPKPQPKPEPKPEPQPEPQPEPTPPSSSSGREVPSGIPSGASFVEGDDRSHMFNYSASLPNGGSVDLVTPNFIEGRVMISGTDNSGRGFTGVYGGKGYGVGFMFGEPDLDDADKSALIGIGIDFLSAYGI